MKKILVLGLIGLFIFTGCSSNKLKCSFIGTDTGKKVTTVINVTFDKNEVSKINEKINMVFDKEYKESIDSIYKALETQNSELEKLDGVKVKTTKGDENIDITIDIDAKKQSGKEIDGITINTKLNRKEMKKELENSGYQCN